MDASDTFGTTTRGWLAGLFGSQPVARPSRWVRPMEELAETGAIALSELVSEFTEQRARAATSGFEMGEYEPLARRN